MNAVAYFYLKLVPKKSYLIPDIVYSVSKSNKCKQDKLLQYKRRLLSEAFVEALTTNFTLYFKLMKIIQVNTNA